MTFHVLYRRHSNPSPSGTFKTRLYEGPTWGIAVIGAADLDADPLPANPPKPDAGRQRPNGKQDADAEGPPAVIANARILPSGYKSSPSSR